MDEHTSTTTATMAAKLAAIADLLTQHPGLPDPYVAAFSSGNISVNYYLHISHGLSHDEQRETASRIVRALGGEWTKEADDFDQALRLQQQRWWGDVQVTVHREAVCERVVVGTEEVTIPATEAAVIEAQPERTETRDVVEWRCSSLLGGRESADAGQAVA